MVRYSEIVITRRIYALLGLTFKRDEFGYLVFARSNYGNSITNSLSGCYPLYLLGYDKDTNVYQCIEFDYVNDRPTKYSEDLKNLIAKKIKTFYEGVSTKTPIIIYYKSITLLPDYGITTKFRTGLAHVAKVSFDIGYTIREIKERETFEWIEYSISHYMYYNAYYKPDINYSIRLLTSKLSNPDLRTEPTPIYHYAVTIQGSAKLQIELTATKCEDGWKRIIVNGPQKFLDDYDIPLHSNFIGFRQIPYSKHAYTPAALDNLLPEEHLEFINKIRGKMMIENTKFVLFLTATDVYEYNVTINKKETVGIRFNPENNKVTIKDPANNPYDITNDSTLVKIVYNDKAVELNTANGFEKYQEFKDRKEDITTEEATFITLHFITNDPKKAPKEEAAEHVEAPAEPEPESKPELVPEPESKPELVPEPESKPELVPEPEPNLGGGKSYKTKRHRKNFKRNKKSTHRKTKRHRKKSKRIKKTYRRKY